MPRVRPLLPTSAVRRRLNSQKAPQPRVGWKRFQFCKLELRVAVHEGALSLFHCAISSYARRSES